MAVGAAAGLALGLGLGGGRVARAIIGGILGAAVAAVIYEFGGAVVFPLDRTYHAHGDGTGAEAAGSPRRGDSACRPGRSGPPTT